MGHPCVAYSKEEYQRINDERRKQGKKNFGEVKFECGFLWVLPPSFIVIN